jgi:hypothetical protein
MAELSRLEGVNTDELRRLHTYIHTCMHAYIQHKAELRRLEEVNTDELRRQRETLSEAHERAMNELRERMLFERERVSV